MHTSCVDYTLTFRPTASSTFTYLCQKSWSALTPAERDQASHLHCHPHDVFAKHTSKWEVLIKSIVATTATTTGMLDTALYGTARTVSCFFVITGRRMTAFWSFTQSMDQPIVNNWVDTQYNHLRHSTTQSYCCMHHCLTMLQCMWLKISLGTGHTKLVCVICTWSIIWPTLTY